MRKKCFILIFCAAFYTLIVAISIAATSTYNKQLAAEINNAIIDGPEKANFQIDAATVAKILKENKGSIQIIDVRVGKGAKEKYENAHIPGAIYIPYNELFKTGQLCKLDKNKMIVLVCHIGATEELGIIPLRMLGYDARAMLLGMSGWQKNYPDQSAIGYFMNTANNSDFPLDGTGK